MKKKGQVPPPSGTSAAMLVAIIAAMIILYILFLPPEDRAKILEEDLDDDNNDNSNDLDGKILLKEDPGRLDLIKKKTIEHKISSFSLVSSTEGELLAEFDSVHVENSASGDAISVSFDFDIEKPKNTDNVLLSITSKGGTGRLIISLNGGVISEKTLDEQNPPPIKISKSLLEEVNTLTFSVPKPPKIMFWKTYSYDLEDIKIFGDITDNSGLENTQKFFITEVEHKNLEKATLQFMTNCKTNKIGTLNVIMNFEKIYSGIPDCEIPIKLELGPERIIDGENTIKFSADQGSYVLDQIKLTSNLKEEIYQTYYFQIEEDEYELIEDDEIDINMSIIFVKDRNDFQDIEVEINGRKFSIDNKERLYSEIIDPYVREGNNAITLRPLDGTVEVVELKILIVDEDEDDNNN